MNFVGGSGELIAFACSDARREPLHYDLDSVGQLTAQLPYLQLSIVAHSALRARVRNEVRMPPPIPHHQKHCAEIISFQREQQPQSDIIRIAAGRLQWIADRG